MTPVHVSPPVQVTPSNGCHHFFGYYGIPPWNASGLYLAYLETTFQDRMPVVGDRARICIADLHEGTHRVVAETNGWNFQQGAMLHWLPSRPGRALAFNDCTADRSFSRVLDIESGETWELPRPFNGVAHRKDIAACVNFARLYKNRRVTSLPVAHDYSTGGVHPDDDGIFIMDLQSGNLDLALTLDEIWKANPHTTALDDELLGEIGKQLWFNHVAFNKGDTRVHFLARYADLFGSLATSMWTAGIDGTEPFLLVDFGHQLSHFEWIDDVHLVVTMNWPDSKHKSHVRVVDREGPGSWMAIAPDKLTRDGHCHVSPDGTLMATDTYIVNGHRHVCIVDLGSGDVHRIASFANPPWIDHNVRCDPHPRWSRDGKQLCYDGLTASLERQVFVVDVGT